MMSQNEEHNTARSRDVQADDPDQTFVKAVDQHIYERLTIRRRESACDEEQLSREAGAGQDDGRGWQTAQEQGLETQGAASSLNDRTTRMHGGDESDLDSFGTGYSIAEPRRSDDKFVNPETFKPGTDYFGPRVVEKYLYCKDHSFRALSVKSMLDKWKFPLSPAETTRGNIQRYLMSELIPTFKQRVDIKGLSELLEFDNVQICDEVILASHEFVFSPRATVSADELIYVEENIWNKLCQRPNQVFSLGLLNLMIWSSFLCNSNRQEVNTDALKAISQTRKDDLKCFMKEKNGETTSSDLFKSMYDFHEDFPSRLSHRGSLPLGKESAKSLLGASVEELRVVRKATYCDKFSHLYSLLRQVQTTGCEGTMSYLNRILTSLFEEKNVRQRHTLSMLMVTGCRHALLHHFARADVNTESSEKASLAKLISMTIDTAFASLPSTPLKTQTNKQEGLQRLQHISLQTKPLAFHLSVKVRKCVRQEHQKYLQKLDASELIAREIERRQAHCSLAIDTRFQVEEVSRRFSTLRGTMGQEKVRIQAYIPSIENLYSGADIHDLFEADKSQSKFRQENNLNLLRIIPSNNYIIQLHAYQIKPVPLYYITEDYPGTLLDYVLERRKGKRWLDKHRLARFVMDVAHGLEVLHKRNIILRDFSLGNFFLVGDNSRVKIADLGLACRCTDNNNNFIDLSPDNIPTRWMSPEVLVDGVFSPQTDMWAMGIFILVLWTHGCEPFVEWKNLTTDVIMTRVAFDDLVPYHWMCIPEEIYELASQCFNRESRIRLSKFQEDLANIHQRFTSEEESESTPVSEIHMMDKLYPDLTDKLITSPETGLTLTIREIRKDKNRMYQNTSVEQWKYKSSVPRLQETDLISQDELLISRGQQYGETVTDVFVQQILPLIPPDVYKANETEITSQCPGYSSLIRTYSTSDKLLDVALFRKLRGSWHSEENVTSYIDLCLQVAVQVQALHEQGLIHRDIRAKNFLIDITGPQVHTCRIGHMTKLPECGVIHDRVFSESRWWLPPEALINMIYTPSGDVYMWAMMTFEVLQAYDLFTSRARRNHLLVVPYCMIPTEKLAEIKHMKPDLDKPDSCPTWLYEFLKRCWNPDRTKRPSMTDVVSKLQRNLTEDIEVYRVQRERELIEVYDDFETCRRETYGRQSAVLPVTSRPRRKGLFARVRKTFKKITSRANNQPVYMNQAHSQSYPSLTAIEGPYYNLSEETPDNHALVLNPTRPPSIRNFGPNFFLFRSNRNINEADQIPEVDQISQVHQESESANLDIYESLRIYENDVLY